MSSASQTIPRHPATCACCRTDVRRELRRPLHYAETHIDVELLTAAMDATKERLRVLIELEVRKVARRVDPRDVRVRIPVTRAMIAALSHLRELGRRAALDEAASMGVDLRARRRARSYARRTLAELVRDLEARYPGLKLDASERGGVIKLSRIVVPVEQRSRGIGSTVMRELTAYADERGATMALSPAADFGGSVPRLKVFYRSHGFVPNTGRGRDLSISETMIRLPAPVEPAAISLPTPTPHVELFVPAIAGTIPEGLERSVLTLAAHLEQFSARLRFQAIRTANTKIAGAERAGLITGRFDARAIMARAIQQTPGALDAAGRVVSMTLAAGMTDVFEANADAFAGWLYTAVLDGATCDECEAADGTEYATWAEAMVDLPDGGPNPNCYGGTRCRCRLVPIPLGGGVG